MIRNGGPVSNCMSRHLFSVNYGQTTSRHSTRQLKFPFWLSRAALVFHINKKVLQTFLVSLRIFRSFRFSSHHEKCVLASTISDNSCDFMTRSLTTIFIHKILARPPTTTFIVCLARVKDANENHISCKYLTSKSTENLFFFFENKNNGDESMK